MFQRVQHNGYHNTYSFTKDGHKVVLKPMHLGEFAQRSKPVELMMRGETIDHLGKRRLVLFARPKEKPMEEDDEFIVELSFVEGLYLRTSLSQPRENGVNAQAQAQAQVLVQAHFQA